METEELHRPPVHSQPRREPIAPVLLGPVKPHPLAFAQHRTYRSQNHNATMRLHLRACLRARALVHHGRPGRWRGRWSERPVGRGLRGTLRGLLSHRRRTRPSRPRDGEVIHRTFPQRRFENAGEREFVLRELAAAGIDPMNKEESGWYHADPYLSRPAEDVAETPADHLLGASGALDSNSAKSCSFVPLSTTTARRGGAVR